MTRKLSSWSAPSLALAALAVLAVGVLLGVVLVPVETPAAIAPTSEISSAVATRVETVDEQAATLVVTVAEAPRPTVRMPGTLTTSSCIPGTNAISGAAGTSVDDMRLLQLSTSRPLWRDLAIGTVGQDVQSLQEELSRLGHAIQSDGRFGAATLNAVRKLATGAGITDAASWSGLPMSRVLWLPKPAASWSSCLLQPGETVIAESPLGTLSQSVESARLSPLPASVIAGARVVTVGELDLAVDTEGVVSASEALTALEASPAYRERLGQGPAEGDRSHESQDPTGAGVRIPVKYRLAAPASVFSVPASSLYATGGDSACVLADGRPVGVTLAGSELGQAFVIPEVGVELDRVALRTEGAPPCRKP